MIPRIVTPRGWGWAVGSLLALVLGATLGWSELIALGCAGILSFAISTLFALVPHAHQVSFHLAEPRVVVGEPARVIVTLTNPTRRRLAALTVDIPVGEGFLSRSVGRLKGGQDTEMSLDIPTEARGILSVGPVRIVRQDPLGLVSREVSHGAATTLYVHPLTIGLVSMSTGFVRDLEGNPTRDLTNSDLSFHALREYVPGDDRRNIHWKSTAKTGRFMVRQFEQSRRSHLLIALDANPEDYGDGQEFELAVSIAASLGVRALRDTRDLSVLRGMPPVVSRRSSRTTASRAKTADGTNLRSSTSGSAVTRTRAALSASTASTIAGATSRTQAGLPSIAAVATASRARLLDDLAGVSLAPESPRLSVLAKLSAGHSADVSVGFLLTGSIPDAKTIHAASVSFPAGVEVVTIVCQPEATPGLKMLGRLTVITVGRLDDIKQILGRKKVMS